jgi:hypothetical protein
MGAPRQMTEFTLNALKGWPQPAAVDFHTTYDPSLLADDGVVLAGACCHLSSAGQYLLGVGSKTVMPLFMFNSSDDPDVNNGAPDASTTRGAYVPINPTGQAMSLVGIGAYELVSTAFVAGTYFPNDHLTSALTGGTAGQLKKGTLWTDTIVGVVSRGVVDNGYGFDAIAFWPHYLPPDAAHAVAP